MQPSLRHLKLTNFRSYSFHEFSCDKSLTIIHGPNGAGKTNLLEAISLLTPGRGLRNARLDEISRNLCGEWSVIGDIGGYKIATGLEKGAVKRIVKIDDQKQKGTTSLAQYTSCIWLTPQMDGIFLKGSTERRQFFDRIIYNFDAEHAARVAIYENAMRERLRLIKNNSNDNTWLRVLEQRMAEYGIAIAAARNEVIGYLIESLNPPPTPTSGRGEVTESPLPEGGKYLSTLPEGGMGLGKFPRPEIEIRGEYETLLHEKSALEVEDIFAHNLLESRLADFRSGRTLNGVHKTDFHVINANKNIAAALSSTGEQKALLLSIILALARLLKNRKNKTPIVLLDEVIAHLDEDRRYELFAEIAKLGCQCFMTGTDEPVFSAISGSAQFINLGGH